MGKSSQRKGRGGEQELAKILQERGFPVEVGRAVSFGSTPDLTGLPGIHCECKRVEKSSLTDWLKQAAADAERFGDGLPAVFWRKNRGRWVVCMDLDDWLRLYRKGVK